MGSCFPRNDIGLIPHGGEKGKLEGMVSVDSGVAWALEEKARVSGP